MAKKITAQQGNVYVQKRPFYKRLWFILLILLVFGTGLNKFKGGETTKSSFEPSTSQTSTEELKSKSENPNSSSSNSSSEKEIETGFEPQDVSDSTIESIKTYHDYLTMYEYIVNNYITNYEAMVSSHGFGDTATYQAMRDGVAESIEQQKKQYGIFGKAPIVGKSELVEFLKDYRDELQKGVDEMSAALGG